MPRRFAKTVTFVPDAGGTQILSANPKRVAVVLSAGNVSTPEALTYRFGEAPSAIGDGIFMGASAQPLYLSTDHIGDTVKQALFHVAANGGGVAAVIEVTEA